MKNNKKIQKIPKISRKWRSVFFTNVRHFSAFLVFLIFSYCFTKGPLKHNFVFVFFCFFLLFCIRASKNISFFWYLSSGSAGWLCHWECAGNLELQDGQQSSSQSLSGSKPYKSSKDFSGEYIYADMRADFLLGFSLRIFHLGTP